MIVVLDPRRDSDHPLFGHIVKSEPEPQPDPAAVLPTDTPESVKQLFRLGGDPWAD